MFLPSRLHLIIKAILESKSRPIEGTVGAGVHTDCVTLD